MSGESFDSWLQSQAADRVARGLHRELRPRAAGDDTVDLAGNDYLALAREPSVVAAAAEAARTWGAGATASRLVTGTTQLHTDLEHALAAFALAPAGLVFASGYAANLAVLTALTDADTLLVSDERNHASIVDGCRLSRARTVVTPHADVDAVAAELANRSESRAVVVTDAVFSVDGDVAPIRELHDACTERGAVLVIDEAHAFGVVGPGGRGVAAAAGITDAPDVVRTVTMSKSLGAQGGAVLATEAVVEHLVDTGRTFIFDTGLAPPAAGAALRALQILEERPDLVDRIAKAATSLAHGLELAPPSAAVVSLPIGDPALALAAAQACAARGVRIGCFRPPSVPVGGSVLRATVHAGLTDDDISRAVETISAAVAAVA